MNKLHELKRLTVFGVALAAALLGAALPAGAQQYVFLYKDGNTIYFLRNNGGTIARESNFGTYSSACIWTGNTSDITTVTTFKNGDYYLCGQNSNSTSSPYGFVLNLSTSQTYYEWRNAGNGRIWRYRGNDYTERYLNYTNNAWTVTRNANPGTGAGYTVLFAYSNHDVSLSSPIISGADVLTATGTSNYSVASTALPQYQQFDGYSGTTATSYYWYSNAFQTSFPSGTNINSGIWSLDANGASANVNTSNGTITVNALPATDITMTLTCSVTSNNITKTATKAIVLQGTIPNAPTISVSGNTATITTTAAGTTTIRYTLDGSDPTATTGTVYSGAIDLTSSATSPVTIKAITVRNGNASAVSEEIVTLTLPTPVITVNGSAGTATIACDITGTTIYYTTNGSTPTTSSSQYSGTLSGLSPMTTIKAIAVKDGWNNSPVASATVTIPSGVSGGVVTLFDYEDHNWTYYSGVPSTVDGGNYNTNYLGKLYSPNPRNVKITYNAVNGVNNSTTNVRVSISENETSFIYYKTLEEGTTSGEYPYQVISNPFSVRPSTGSGNSKVYYGFAGWKIVSGGEYIKNHSNDDVLSLDENIVFNNLPYSSVNCTSAEIVFETTWKTANRTYVSTNPGSNQTYNTSGDYESNFYVINCGYTRNITTSGPVTIMMVEPDGSADYRNNTFSGYVNPNNNGVSKIEFAHWTPGNTNVDARGRNLTIGRGMTMDGTRRALYGTNQTSGMNQVLKVESGNFSTFTSYNNTPSSVTKHWVVFGCDYDRAKNDNSKLTFTGKFLTATGMNLGLASTGEMARVWSKSGSFMTGVQVSDAAADNSYYIGVTGTQNNGHRYLEIQGGEWYANIAGGMGEDHTPTEPGFTFRMKGGLIRGSVYGAAAWSNAGGSRTYVLTGGTIKGWVAGGANGTAYINGALYGASYIYVGGNAVVSSNNTNTIINSSIGGVVYGAGCGYCGSSSSGQVTLGTNVVLADNANVERGIYGGGAFGYTTGTSCIYVTGGTLGGLNGGYTVASCSGTTQQNSTRSNPAYNANINGGVFGGASQNRGGTVKLYMTGGTVNASVYGGSNHIGVLSGTSTVKMFGGTINGSLYGGGNGTGDATNITGAVDVSVYGGKLTGAVYGCNNVSGAPQSTVTVDVYGTDPAPSAGSYAINQVFGGGNQADYSGTPVVTVHCTDANKDISVGEIYGGGNQANVEATNVTIEAGNIIGDVYGGGRQADVSGNTVVNVNGGTVRRVFGGNNISGTISGTISVTANKTTACPMMIGELYGGGNEAASQAGSISIGCTGDITAAHHAVGADNGTTPPSAIGYTLEGIGDVYGGANNALVTGNITLNIESGMIYRVFGGNNTGNTVNGNITVNIAKGSSTCGWYIGYVYGGGNNAPYTNAGLYPKVNVTAGTVTYNVYGGGKGTTAKVTGNPQVTLSGNVHVGGSVYGGGDAAEVEGNTNVLLKD